MYSVDDLKAVEFTVPGKPHGQGRPRFSGKTGGVYQAKADTEYKKRVAECFREAVSSSSWPMGTDGPVHLLVYAYDKIGSSEPKRTTRMDYIKKPDVDNVAKAVMDALTGAGAWKDDSQVVSLHVVKCSCRRDTEPRVFVRMAPMEFEDED